MAMNITNGSSLFGAFYLLKYQERIFILKSLVVAAAPRKALVADDQSFLDQKRADNVMNPWVTKC